MPGLRKCAAAVQTTIGYASAVHDDYQVPTALFFVPAGVFFAIFLVSFAFDRRKVRNGLYLFFALVFLVGASLMALASKSLAVAEFVLISLLFLFLLMILVLAVFLVANGVTMIRREGRRLANLLSLAAGLGIFAYIGLRALANSVQWTPLQATMDAIGAVISYVSLLFMCFLLYSFVYGRIWHRRAVDFVVVLGSGLIGSRVPPLLASRLDRGRAVFDAQRAKGRDPVLVTSGGQGPGEDLPEARAMADYLIDKGVPEDRILVEDQSRSTEENLRFSKAIMQQHRPKYRCVVVTNNYHVMRAATIARKGKVNGQVLGSPTARYFWPSATIREFVAVFLSHKIVNFCICAFLIITNVLPALQDG
ncbi:YdcF family protein [Saccharopolyspora elongata]|uniref:YdcF family protein n=1 Tax=Saccharopolyspora elongata TaxID=2530387 RepID=A0A4R4YHJ8_9PSEU|nr:YdcF family protein [Saccharopolyspora elongata]